MNNIFIRLLFDFLNGGSIINPKEEENLFMYVYLFNDLDWVFFGCS